MLTLHAPTGKVHPPPADLGTATLMPGIVWIDLLKPSPAETAFVKCSTGLHLPSVEDLSEIETSSRLRVHHGILYLSAPLVHRAGADIAGNTPIIRSSPLGTPDGWPAKAPAGQRSPVGC
jgi:hypothetical protein